MPFPVHVTLASGMPSVVAMLRQPPVTPATLRSLHVLGRPKACMHTCRKLRGVNVRFIPALGEADAVLNSVTGVQLARVDCWTCQIMPLPFPNRAAAAGHHGRRHLRSGAAPRPPQHQPLVRCCRACMQAPSMLASSDHHQSLLPRCSLHVLGRS